MDEKIESKTALRPTNLRDVEEALVAHPKVTAAVVVTTGAADDKGLVAYIVVDGLSPTVGQLRGHLQERLPSHLVPAVYVTLDQVPRTADGGIDHAALPQPNPVWAAAEQEYVAPRNGIESFMASLWAKVLMLDRIGVHDDFLELGGDSLLAVQIVAGIFERYGIEVPVEMLFERGTIANIVADYFADGAVEPSR